MDIELGTATNNAVNNIGDLLFGDLLLLRTHLMRLLLARDEEQRKEKKRSGSQSNLHEIKSCAKDPVTVAKQHSVPEAVNLVRNAMTPNV